MSKRLPPLNALRVFDAAARHLSFTRAADELFVTQAAVSHQIKSLEDFLGLKLFRRRNRSLLLTEEGQSYFQDIKEIFSQLTEATRKLQARSAKGALTVSLLPSFAIQWLVPRLTSFNSAYPGIDVRIGRWTVRRISWRTMSMWRFLRPRQLAGPACGKIVRRVSAAGLFPALAHRRQSIENACRSGATYPASRCVPPRLANLYPSAWSKPY